MASYWGFFSLLKVWFLLSSLLLCYVLCTLEGNLLPDCNAKSPHKTVLTGKDEIREQLFISTLDGRVSALDPLEGGSILWSHTTGAIGLFSSSMSKLKMNSNGRVFRLVPSLDGSLYRFNGDSLERLPLHAENLLKSSFGWSEDTVITGGKERQVFGINIATGEVQYTSAMHGSKQKGGDQNNREGLLIVQRVTHTVRAVESRTGDESWNFSVGEHHLSLQEALGQDCTQGQEQFNPQVTKSQDSLDLSGYTTQSLSYRFDAKEGFIGASQGMGFSWSHKFDFPIVQAWLLKKGRLEMIDMFELRQMLHAENPAACSKVTAPADIYFGVHHEEYYIQHSPTLGAKIQEKLIGTPEQQYNALLMPRIEFKPYLLSGSSRTPHVNIGKQTPVQIGSIVEDKTTAVALQQDYLDYPYDAGFYLQSNSNLQPVTIENETECNTRESSLLDLDDSIEEEEAFIIITSLWHWWKEVLAISIATSIFVNLFITRFALKRWKQKILAESSSSSELQSTQLSQSKSSSEKTGDRPALSTQDSGIVSDLAAGDASYKSRYLTDFEPIRRFGKGGFGVVFEARNIMDDCHYAVKRISLPNREEDREKMMREVKALAKLDHAGIVRYFNAWQECPPPGWQEHLDHQWDASGHPSVTASVTSPSFSSKPLKPSVQSLFRNPFNRIEFSNITEIANKNTTSTIKSTDGDESGSFSSEKGQLIKSMNSGDSSFEIVFQKSQTSEGTKPKCLKTSDNLFSGSSNNEFRELSSIGEDSGCGDRSQSMHDDIIEASENFECDNKAKLNRPDKLELLPVEAAELQPDRIGSSKLYLYIQMQLCRKETLKDWLTVHKERDRDEILDIFDQIVSAVQYVHECSMMHRDLKPSNIFFSTDGIVKVGDFGLVTALSETEAHTPADPNNPNKALPEEQKPRSTQHTDQVGTELYMSPEQIAGEPYSYKVDVYSLGLIFFELLVPFSTQMERLKVLMNLKKHIFPEEFKIASPNECEFVQHLLSKDPRNRPSVHEMKLHPLLKPFQPEPRSRRHRNLSHRASSSGSECEAMPKENCQLYNVVTASS